MEKGANMIWFGYIMVVQLANVIHAVVMDTPNLIITVIKLLERT